MKKDQKDYLKNWLFRANEDIAVLNSLFKSDPSYYASSICYHAQQAVEKFLKAFLVFHSVDFKRTHDVDFLLLECKKIDPNGFDMDLGSLADFSKSLRYPDDFYIPDKEETIRYRDVAIEVKKVVEQKINCKHTIANTDGIINKLVTVFAGFLHLG